MFYSSIFFKQLVIIHCLMLIASFQDFSLLRLSTEDQRSKVPGSILYNLDVYYIVAEATVKLSLGSTVLCKHFSSLISAKPRVSLRLWWKWSMRPYSPADIYNLYKNTWKKKSQHKRFRENSVISECQILQSNPNYAAAIPASSKKPPVT